MKSTGLRVACLLIAIAVSAFGLSALGYTASSRTEAFSVVASFYPLYTAALNVVGGCDGVAVSCLTPPSAGCLHDYQLSPSERAALGGADLLLLNGAGMEAFLEPVLESLPSLTCVDTSVGLDLLSCEEHEHEHGQHHEHTVNEHLWLDPARYAAQVSAICEALCEALPEQADLFRENAAAYRQQIDALEADFTALDLPFEHAVLFHDSVAYVAESFGLQTAGVIPLGEDQAASAAELAAIADAMRGKNVLLLYDAQYTAQHETLGEYAAVSATVHWNTAVGPLVGVEAKDTWLEAMRRNLKTLEEVIEWVDVDYIA